MKLELIPIGSPVLLGQKIEAIVTAISIKHNNSVSYQVAWANGGIRYEQWVIPAELSSNLASYQEIGFLT